MSEEDKEIFAQMIAEITMNPKAHREFREEIDRIFKEEIYPKCQSDEKSKESNQ